MKLTIDNPKIIEILDGNVMGLNKTDVEECLALGDGTIRDFMATGEEHFLDCFKKMRTYLNENNLVDCPAGILFIKTSGDVDLLDLSTAICRFRDIYGLLNMLIGLKCCEGQQKTFIRLISIQQRS